MADAEDQILRWDPEPGEFLDECKGEWVLKKSESVRVF
jgi:hypothetical protein